MEKLVVYNNSSQGHSLEFNKPLDIDVSVLASHHRRRAIKDNKLYVTLEPRRILDLVEATDMPVKEIERSTSYKRLMSRGFVSLLERVAAEEPVEEVEEEIQPENLEGIIWNWFYEVKSIEDALIGEATFEDIEDLIKTPPDVVKGYYSSTGRKAGRPPGSKNKKKPGRPKSKAKKKPSGRKPGRPKGSKTKKKPDEGVNKEMKDLIDRLFSVPDED